MALNTDSTDYLTVRRLWSIMSSFKDKIVTALGKKSDKSSTVSNVAWSSSKLTKTINGTTTDVVTASTLKTAMSLNNVTNDAQVKRTEMGTANGVATLDANGIINTSQLPSYVDDVLEYSAKSQFPATGETGKIYVDTSTNLTWRWGGSAYVEISPSLALGETSSTAYRGDRGKTAYDHSQLTSGNPHNVTADDVKAVSYNTSSQGLTDTQKSNARTNIGLGTSAVKDVPSSGNDASTSQVVMGNDSRLSDARTPTSHTHGNIQNGGTLQTNDVTIASGDKLVVTDSSDSNKIARTSLSFDGSTTTTALTPKGTFESFAKSGDISSAINALDATITSTDGNNVQAKVTETNGKITAVNITTDTTANINNSVYYVAGTTDYAAWVANHAYAVGDNVVANGKAYTCKTAHTSGSSFSTTNWTAIATPTLKGVLPAEVTSLYSGLKISYKMPITGGSSSTVLSLSNGTTELGSKNIRINDSNLTTHLPVNTVVVLTYDGTYWRFSNYDSNSTYSGMVNAYVNNAGDAAKTATCTNFKLTKGVTLWTTFNVANTKAGALTLNVNSTGAKTLYINGAASSSTNYTIDIGTYPCHYNGTNWYLWTDGTYQVQENVLKLTSNGSTITAATGTLTYAKISKLLESGITDIFVDLVFTTGNYLRLFIPLTNCTYPINGNPFLFSTVYNNTLVEVTLNSSDVISGNMFHLGNVANDLSGGTDIVVTTNPTLGTATVAVNTTGTASGTYAFVEGDNTTASGNYSHAEGKRETPEKSIASGEASHVEGIDTLASGVASHAEGYHTVASSRHAHAEGERTLASGVDSHAEGSYSKATGEHSHAEGESYASGKNAHSEGFNITSTGDPLYGAQGVASHSEGSVTYAYGTSAHAEGGGTNALGKDSHAEGFSDVRPIRTTLTVAHAANSSSFTIPSDAGTITTSMYVLIKIGEQLQFVSKIRYVGTPSGGNLAIATEDSCDTALSIGADIFIISEGASVGMASHTEGFSCTAIGKYAHAEGFHTLAIGESSHAEGQGTVARSSYMHAAGQYNITDTGLARVTGWGTASSKRDIERLDTNGLLWVSGHFFGATPFHIVPGTTTYADISAAYDEQRPMVMDVSYLMSGANALDVPVSVRKVPYQGSLDHFEYHFKFEYPFNYRAAWYSGGRTENYSLYECYVAINEEQGWLRLDLSDPNNLESWVWNSWNTSGTTAAPIPVQYAIKANSANYATNYYSGGTIDSAFSGKMNTNASNAASGALQNLTAQLDDGTDDFTDGTEMFTSYANNNGFATSGHVNEPYRRKASSMKNYIAGYGTGFKKVTDSGYSTTGITYGDYYSSNTAMYGWKIGTTTTDTANANANLKAIVVITDWGQTYDDYVSSNFVGILDITARMHTNDTPSIGSLKMLGRLTSLMPQRTSNSSGKRGWTVFAKANQNTYQVDWYIGRNSASSSMNLEIKFTKLVIMPIMELNWSRVIERVTVSTMTFPESSTSNFWGQYITTANSYSNYSVGSADTPVYVNSNKEMSACTRTKLLNRFEKDDDFTVSMSDISSATVGTVYTYICTNPASYITAKWTGPAGQSCSANVSNGYAASFVLTNTNGRFARIS